MGNVTLPTPVFLAGGGLCLVAGYLVGATTGPDTTARTTARVVSFQSSSSRLCLEGGAAHDQPGADGNGVLCGRWAGNSTQTAPREGDVFRFVSVAPTKAKRAKGVVIYGGVTD